MILGIGIDIIEIERIEIAINRNKKFIDKFFTEKEINYFKNKNMNSEHIAGNFSAKEAVSKALGTGFSNIKFKDISIERNDKGKPSVILSGEAEKIASEKGKYKMHLSISHSKRDAIAYAVWEII